MKYIIAIFCLSLAAIANSSAINTTDAKPLSYTIIAERSHKPSLFTQGLLAYNGNFYESSGLYGKSLLVSYPIVEPASTWAKMTAPFAHKQIIPERFFAEGLTLLNNKLYLLTWQEGTVFIYDANTLNLQNTFYYTGEGWGLANDGKYIIRSDGSSNLFFHNANTFLIEKTLPVTLNQAPVQNLNELEFFDGFIWANIWHDNRILKINPLSGQVVGVLDASAIVTNLHLTDTESVLNGIAYDADKKAVWITGKQWPKMYLIKIDH